MEKYKLPDAGGGEVTFCYRSVLVVIHTPIFTSIRKGHTHTHTHMHTHPSENHRRKHKMSIYTISQIDITVFTANIHTYSAKHNISYTNGQTNSWDTFLFAKCLFITSKAMRL